MAGIYGDITKVMTTGASEKTSKGLGVKGVEASHKLAESDLKRVDQYKSMITKVAKEKQIDPAIVAGIISRESRAGLLLKDGWGDNHNGFGLMQVDKNAHPDYKKPWNGEEHIRQGVDILISFIKQIQDKFPSWSKENQLKGGIAAYNLGVKNIKTLEGMDVKSSGDDYSSDVVARAQWFNSHGY
ncbi:lysozyme g-like [Trichomycterus rosablanca]|uniref:lysozyme g-like n=1 Tax=Trichomycterus rosablanca TaxID=2290929 RepID=UPI002F355BEF